IEIVPGGIFSFNSLDPNAGQEPQFVNGGAVTLGNGGTGPSSLFWCQNYHHRSGSLTGRGQVNLEGATFGTAYTVAVSGFGLNAGYSNYPKDIHGPGTITIPAGYTVQALGPIDAPLVNQGTLLLSSATVTGPLTNSGTIKVSGSTWNTPGDSTNSGT